MATRSCAGIHTWQNSAWGQLQYSLSQETIMAMRHTCVAAAATAMSIAHNTDMNMLSNELCAVSFRSCVFIVS